MVAASEDEALWRGPTWLGQDGYEVLRRLGVAELHNLGSPLLELGVGHGIKELDRVSDAQPNVLLQDRLLRGTLLLGEERLAGGGPVGLGDLLDFDLEDLVLALDLVGPDLLFDLDRLR